MKIRMFALGLAAALMALPVLADGVDGKWNASVDTPQGPFALVFEFKAEGAKLTGNMSNDFMGATPISEGTVKGNDVTFQLKIDTGQGPAMTINYKGTVKGDELTLISKFEGEPPGGGPAESTLVAKRAK
jgi:hypothetical protein